jgi:hypothetical protein
MNEPRSSRDPRAADTETRIVLQQSLNRRALRPE